MSAKTYAEVVVAGKVYTISGYESEEYLQKLASYINSKYSEYSKEDSFKKLNIDYQSLLLQLNMADDYYKAKNQVALLEEQLNQKDDEIYTIKRDLIASQVKLDNSDKNLLTLQETAKEYEKKIAVLETELKANKKNL